MTEENTEGLEVAEIEELAAEQVTNTTTTKNKGGRPKGSIAKIPLMDLNKRIKVLAKIVNDKEEKTSDRIAAVLAITNILNDKVQKESLENPITTITFEENKVNPSVPPEVTTSTTTPPKKVTKKSKSNEIDFDFDLHDAFEEFEVTEEIESPPLEHIKPDPFSFP